MPSASPIPSPFDGDVRFAVRRAGEQRDYCAPAEEVAAIGAGWAARRTAEFLLGRAAAASALRALRGDDPPAVGRGPNGEPLWPDGVVGAITHTRGIAAAAVAHRASLLGVGLDLEPLARRISAGVSRLVCTDGERPWADADGEVAGERRPGLRLKLLFSAKESVFKATCPIAGVHLGYKDAELCWDEARRCFHARLLVAAGPGLAAGAELEVGCRVHAAAESYLLTFVSVPNPL
jgi:4'-phosphopantetheinyl transferase EntD